MAEELIVGGAGEIVKRAISLAFDELGLVIGVKGDVNKLKDVLTHIHAVLQDAEEKQVKENRVKVWLQELKQLSYDAEDVLDVIAYNELKYSTGWLNNPLRLATRTKMAHRIKAINLELHDINERKNDFQLKTNDQASASSSLSVQMIDRETTSRLKDNVIGRECDKEDIIKMLINHDHGSSSSSNAGNNIALPVIAIVGLGGLGKTTLAQLVYNDDVVKKHFELKVWICVSTNFRTTNLFFQILQQINPNNALPESSSKQVLLQGLESQLVQQGTKTKFLLVLDDDWNENQETWEDFVFSLRDNVGTGSRIIVTSRDSNVASIRGDQTVHVHQLQGLSEYSCWDIIKSRAFKNGEPVKPSLLEIGKQISDKCKGVPLAAKILGGMLQSKREDHEWEAARDADFWKVPSDGTEQIMEVLKFSYYNLPSALKSCFSYCAIFPKDYFISRESLIQLWMAQGLLGASNNSQEEIMEDKGNTYFNTLYSKSFFQEAEMNEYGEVIECKMHDLVHDLAQSICKFECQNLRESNNTIDFSKCRHASFISPKTLKVLTKAKKVRTIFGWGSTSIMFDDGGTVGAIKISSFFKFKLLRVLDLSGFEGSDFSSSLGKLKHLRYLDLSYTSIKSLPKWVTRLYHLQTLKLIYCSELVELPEDLINLKKLRHLFIDDGGKWKKMPQAMGKLDELQTLPVFEACQENGISVLENLNNLRGTLEIRRMGLVREARLAKRANVLSKKSKLRKLKLYWDRHSSIGDEGGGDLHVLEVLQPHPNLHNLFIEGFGGVQFPRWMSNGSLLPNLKSMKISNCSNCEHIPSFGELACLERLEIMNMSNVKSIGGSKDERIDTITTPQSSSYSCLKVLELISMPNLEEWFEGNEVCFEELSITSCPNLRMTPHSFPSLKSLKLEDVGGMGVVSITSSLTSLTSLSITHCKDLEFLSEGLLKNNDQLISFSIYGCPKLRVFQEEGIMVSNSSSLRELQIEMCDALKSIPDVRGLTSLQKLEIRRCQELETIPKGFWSSFVALESLNIYRCKKLKGTIDLSPSLKHLRQVGIEKCPNLKGFDVRSFASLRELKIVECSGLHALQGLLFMTALEKLSIGGFSPALLNVPPLISKDEGDDAVEFKNLFPSLRELEIMGWPALQALPHHLQHLTTLKSLIIEDFTNVTELQEWIGNLASLEKLKIWQCENLTHLPSLTFLRKLDIGWCPSFQSIKQPVLPWCHTSLQELRIRKCDGVTSIELGSFVCLRKLNVSLCSGLQSLQGLPFLTALEKLVLGEFSEDSNCFPSLLGDDYDDEVASNTPLLPSLRKLDITGWFALQALPHHLQHLTMLKSLSISYFMNLMEFPEWIGNLASLARLKINWCANLTHLPSKKQMQRLTFLEELRIQGCPRLKDRCRRDGPEWPKISHIPYLHIID